MVKNVPNSSFTLLTYFLFYINQEKRQHLITDTKKNQHHIEGNYRYKYFLNKIEISIMLLIFFYIGKTIIKEKESQPLTLRLKSVDEN